MKKIFAFRYTAGNTRRIEIIESDDIRQEIGIRGLGLGAATANGMFVDAVELEKSDLPEYVWKSVKGGEHHYTHWGEPVVVPGTEYRYVDRKNRVWIVD